MIKDIKAFKEATDGVSYLKESLYNSLFISKMGGENLSLYSRWDYETRKSMDRAAKLTFRIKGFHIQVYKVRYFTGAKWVMSIAFHEELTARRIEIEHDNLFIIFVKLHNFLKVRRFKGFLYKKDIPTDERLLIKDVEAFKEGLKDKKVITLRNRYLKKMGADSLEYCWDSFEEKGLTFSMSFKIGHLPILISSSNEGSKVIWQIVVKSFAKVGDEYEERGKSLYEIFVNLHKFIIEQGLLGIFEKGVKL